MKTIIILSLVVVSMFLFSGCNKALQVDEQGCKTSLGYSWCDAKQKCLKDGIEQCVYVPKLSVAEVIGIAQDSECTEFGEISGGAFRLDSDFKWTLGLNIKPEFAKQGCDPLCVVSEEFKTAEIDWRCEVQTMEQIEQQ